MSKMQEKSDPYRISRFTPERLTSLQREVASYSKAINGLPQHHSEVLKKRGWLLPFLFGYDSLLWGRWAYWLEIVEKGTIENSGPIPQIQWSDMPAKDTNNMLNRCLQHHEANIDTFADWLLWGLAATTEAPKISETLNKHYYQKFDLFLVLDNPTDYLSYLLCDQTGKGYKQGLGYYPTPFNITRMMVQIVHGDGDTDKKKRQTVYDSCVGCGAMLLPASNYFLRGYGQDISGIAVKLCKIQMYWYAPWYAFPGQVSGFDASDEIKLVPAKAHKNITDSQLAFAF
ncbi:hypothetical protein YDYSY3_38450 [Paenibacillus chitinolyticus]|uniref:N-6 DNA methylase n=1 Tax=Paenibacillus chitinolyticus TaxID=79263 RepID=UPI0026E4AD86|nr:N-6 DNA methylase [Paenibacillus chitinolyticus]GKS12845.1 hypothetical protein YDYSY3_38450 [Paenibacillus chitinolyticus]